MYPYIIGFLLTIGGIFWGTRSDNQDQEILKDIMYQKEKIQESADNKEDDDDFVEILTSLDWSDNSEIKRRFNKIKDPDKRKKVKGFLSKKFNIGDHRVKRDFKEVEYDIEQRSAEITAKQSCKLFWGIFVEITLASCFIVVFYYFFLAKENELEKIFGFM